MPSFAIEDAGQVLKERMAKLGFVQSVPQFFAVIPAGYRGGIEAVTTGPLRYSVEAAASDARDLGGNAGIAVLIRVAPSHDEDPQEAQDFSEHIARAEDEAKRVAIAGKNRPKWDPTPIAIRPEYRS